MAGPEHKHCQRCGRERPLDWFPWNRTVRSPVCGPCISERSRYTRARQLAGLIPGPRQKPRPPARLRPWEMAYLTPEEELHVRRR